MADFGSGLWRTLADFRFTMADLADFRWASGGLGGLGGLSGGLGGLWRTRLADSGGLADSADLADLADFWRTVEPCLSDPGFHAPKMFVTLNNEIPI